MRRHKTHRDSKDVALDPCPLVHHVLDRDATLRQRLGELSNTARAVAHRHRELDQPAVNGEAPLKAASQYRGVDVATAEQGHHSEDLIFFKVQ